MPALPEVVQLSARRNNNLLPLAPLTHCICARKSELIIFPAPAGHPVKFPDEETHLVFPPLKTTSGSLTVIVTARVLELPPESFTVTFTTKFPARSNTWPATGPFAIFFDFPFHQFPEALSPKFQEKSSSWKGLVVEFADVPLESKNTAQGATQEGREGVKETVILPPAGAVCVVAETVAVWLEMLPAASYAATA